MSFMPLFLKTCDNCGATGERVFVDSWTGKELCCECVSDVAFYVTNSPASEGDNLEEQLRERTGQ